MSDRALAPPELLAAVAMSASGDDDVPDGVHLRVMPSPLLGFPLAPFAVYRVLPEEMDLEEVLWRDRSGNGTVLTFGDLDGAGGYLTADWAAPDVAFDVAVQVLSDRTLEGTVSLLDRGGDRVLAQASTEPFIVGGPRVDRLRIEGRAAGVRLRVWRVHTSLVFEHILGGTPDLLSLPIDGDREWYVAGQGEGPAMDVVRSAAPRRLGAPDRPDGPLDGLTADDEELRVAAFREPILDSIERMVGDPSTFPREARLPREVAGEPDQPGRRGTPRQVVALALAGSLLGQGLDPGIGRFLGLVGHRREPVVEPTAYAVLGLFPVDRRLILPGGRRLADLVDDQPAVVRHVAEAYAQRIGAEERIERLLDAWGEHALSFTAFVAVAGAVPPPDRPALPLPRPGRARWLEGAGGPSSTAFSQELLVDDAPLGSLIALGRSEGGTWTTRHRTIELPPPAEPAERAVAMLLGRTGERPPLVPSGLVSDAPIEAAAGTRYRLALADLFGRFGEPAELSVADPPRPPPPTPAPQVELVLDGPVGEEPGPASPGSIVVRVPVPSVAERAAGSLRIAGVQLGLQGSWHEPIDIQPSEPGTIGTVEDRFDLPPFTVGERRTLGLSGIFIDAAGTSGDVAQVPVTVTDRRRPAPLVIARGIVWTSRPGPSPEVELRLTWPGTPGVRYRAYLADATSLGLSGATRADVAKAGGDHDENGTLGGRDRFRLLTDPPLAPGADGRVTLAELLPRSLATVQFLRIVPVSTAGREADFARCRVVPVAVPADRRPPPPRVSAEVADGRQRATVRIEAVGLDLVALRAAEPGLFEDPPAADALAPEFRLRRAAGSIPDPVYAREVARGQLERTEADGVVRFTAVLEDPHDLAPYVPYSYWAEVRLPAERRLIRGADVELPPAAGVAPVDPAQLADAPRPFSAPSAPSTVRGPAGHLVTVLDGAAAAVVPDHGGVRISLTAASTPAASPLAVPGFRLRLWERWGAGDLAPVSPDLPLTGAALDWLGAPRADEPTARPAALVYAVIDPLGRVGPLQELPAPLVRWEPLGGLFTSAPAACALAPGRLVAFGVGLDRRLYSRRSVDDAWAPSWDVIAPDLVNDPLAVAAAPDGTMFLTVRADEDVRYYRSDGAAWTAWPSGGWFTSGVALVARAATDVQVFGIRYSRVWTASWQGGVWSAWQQLPGDPLLALDLAAVGDSDGTDLAVRGRDQRLHHRRWTNGTWGPWEPLPGLAATSAPAIARLSDTELVVLAPGTDSRLAWNRLLPGGPTGWTSLGTMPVAGRPAATSPAPGRVDVFIRGTDRAMHHRWYDGVWHP